MCGTIYASESEAQACGTRSVPAPRFKVGEVVRYHVTHTFQVRVDEVRYAPDPYNGFTHWLLYVVSTKQYVDGMPLLVLERFLEPLSREGPSKGEP